MAREADWTSTSQIRLCSVCTPTTSGQISMRRRPCNYSGAESGTSKPREICKTYDVQMLYRTDY
jgi:hypothetical protein